MTQKAKISMPRARSIKTFRHVKRTAPQYQYDEGSGCLSGFAIVPLAVIFITVSLSLLAWRSNPTIMDLPPVASSTSLSPIFRPEVQYWADSVSSWAAGSNLNPNLVATIMQIESCGDPRALSSAGAMGLFQVMPYHFSFTDNPYNPNTNAARGLDYLARSLEAANGDARLAMAGYNGGISIVHSAEWTWSAETKRYVHYGAPIYQDAVSGVESSAALNDWYLSYGVGLCRQAHQKIGLP